MLFSFFLRYCCDDFMIKVTTCHLCDKSFVLKAHISKPYPKWQVGWVYVIYASSSFIKG